MGIVFKVGEKSEKNYIKTMTTTVFLNFYLTSVIIVLLYINI